MKIINSLIAICFVPIVFSSELYSVPPDSTHQSSQKIKALVILEQGKTKFDEGRTKEALLKFREALQKDANNSKASYWIARCHLKLNNFGYALQYGTSSLKTENGKTPKDIHLLLARAHHELGNLDSANFYYENSLKFLPKQKTKELNVQSFIDQVKLAKEMISKGKKFERKRISGDLNSGYDDYGMITFGENTAYITARKSNTTGGNLNPSDERYFEDIYQLTWNPTSKKWENATNELGKLNSNGFDAMNALTQDGLVAYITLNNTFVPKIKKPTKSSDIYEVKRNKNGKWNSPKPINNKSINTSFFDGSATITADGNTMYFVSDRKAEKSLTDIYFVQKIGNQWGEAKALPETINTVERETTPFISPDGRFLFFASDGHEGMGGYDIYVTENKGGGEWSKPVNLGYGINSVNNDTHFSYNPTTKKGYVSSYNIIGNKSSMDIYEIDFSKGMPFIQQ